MNEIESNKFERAKNDAEAFYKILGKVRCPYFNDEISFNAKGLEHIKFHGPRHARSRNDQYIRFRLISLAPRILQDSHTLQGISRRNNLERIKTNSRWESAMRSSIYYEFVAVINGYRVRVIVKEVGGGTGKYFWSIIPFWKMDKISGRRVMHSGKPETD